MAKRGHGEGSIEWLDKGRVRLRARVDGKQRSKVIHVTHRNHGGRGEAAEALAKFTEQIEEEARVAGRQGAGSTVGQLFADYIARSKGSGRRESTLESYEMVAKRLTPEIRAMRVADLGSHDIDAFYASMTVGPNAVRHTHAVMRAALNQAVKWGWIDTNPANSATPPKAKRTERAPLVPADVARMIMVASAPKDEGGEADVVLAMAIAMAAMTGARRGELCGLRWDDIDVRAQTIRIERQWVPGKGGQHLGDPKSEDGKRTVTLDADGMGIIERYRYLLAEITDHEPFGWILSPEGTETPLRAKTLGYWITDLGAKIGLKVTTHSFRRVAATELVAAGVDVDTAARRMGHTKEVMLGSYVLGADDRQIAAASLLGARFAARGLPLAELLPYRLTPTKELEP